MTAAGSLVADYLRRKRENNAGAVILPGENIVVDALLAASPNLAAAWSELLRKLPAGDKPEGMTCDRWQLVVDAIVATAADVTRDKAEAARDAMNVDLPDLTTKIQQKARALADHLRRRERLCTRFGITLEPDDSDPLDLLEPAARIADESKSISGVNGALSGDTRHRFEQFLAGPLRALRDQFDGRYWPSTADLVEALAQAQDGAALAIRGNIAAVVESRQTSPRDLMRALDAALARLSYFGAAVEFSDAALSAIVNACGSWGESATPESVKTFRHSTR